jgi:hypothetical protein
MKTARSDDQTRVGAGREPVEDPEDHQPLGAAVHAVSTQDALSHRLASELPDLRPPAVLLQRLAETLGGEAVVLLCGDLRPLGFGAYDGQLCLVTPTRVVLATATRMSGSEGAFGVEQWDREIAPLARIAPVLPRTPEPDAG